MTASAPEIRRGKWPLVEGGLIGAVALGAIAFQLWLPFTRVDQADYRAVAQVLEAEGRATDAVLLFPWWTERARLFLPERFPIVGFLGSDSADLVDHERIWVLSQPRLPRSNRGAFEAAFLPGRKEIGQERRFGNLSLRLFSNGRHRPVLFRARELLAQLSVYIEIPGGERQVCPWNGAAHACPNGKNVEAQWHEMHFEPRQCLRFDPPGGQRRLVVELPPVPSAADQLVLHAGYIWDRGSFREGVSASEVGLEVQGRTQAITLQPGQETMSTLRVTDVPQGAVVQAFVSAQNPNAREICLEISGYGRNSP